MTSPEPCTCTCCDTVPACWCGKNRNEATGPVAPDEDGIAVRMPVWEVMLKNAVSAGPLTSVVNVTAEHMQLDTNEPWTFDFWNGARCYGDDVVAAFPFDAVVGVRRV